METRGQDGADREHQRPRVGHHLRHGVLLRGEAGMEENKNV